MKLREIMERKERKEKKKRKENNGDSLLVLSLALLRLNLCRTLIYLWLNARGQFVFP